MELTEAAESLADGVLAALPAWVVRCVEEVMVAWRGGMTPEAWQAAEAAAAEARAGPGVRIRELLLSDIDDQRATPLSLVREAVRFPTRVLHEAGAPPVARDRFSVGAFPGDDYGLTPASLADVDPGLAELGIAWGAAKALEHKRRHGG